MSAQTLPCTRLISAALTGTPYESMKNKFEKYTIPHILVFTKRDTAASGKQEELRLSIRGIFTEVGDVQSLTALKNAIGEELKAVLRM